MSSPTTAVAVVDDHALFAEAVVLALRLDGFTATGVVPDDRASVQTVHREVLAINPGVALLDLDLGRARNGMSLVSSLTANGVNVVVVSGHLPPARAGEALSLGARCAVPKTAALADIVLVIRRLAAGLPVISRQQSEMLLGAWRAEQTTHRELQTKLDRLTKREAEVLGQLMRGQQVSDIARAGFVSESTVRTHVKAVLAKLQVSSQLAAVGMAHRVGWRAPGHERTPRRGGGQPGDTRAS